MIVTYLFFTLLVVVSADDCGSRKIDVDIRSDGVHEAIEYAFPWNVALEKLDSGRFFQFCGAAVLNKRWIITTASCVYMKSVKELRGVFGSNDIKKRDSSAVISSFEKIIVHEAYNQSSFVNDIALLYTTVELPSFSSSPNINAICLPNDDHKPEGSAVVSGWGAFDEQSDPVSRLRYLKVKLVDDDQCSQAYGKRFHPKFMLCAEYPKHKLDACWGNGGSPLEVAINGKEYVIGIVSFGDGCGREGYPSVYTQVSGYLPWIIDNIKA